jgi:hypothetical protein
MKYVWLLLLAGCDSILGLGETKFTGDAQMPDAKPPDACTTCGTYASCEALKIQQPAAPSGVYNLSAGPGSTPFAAYCDQTGDGGGWTLALKVDGRLQTFNYDNVIWEDDTLLGTTTPGFDHTEAKLETWNAFAISEVRLGIEYPIDSGDIRYIVLPLPAAKLADLFAPAQSRTTAAGRDTWKGMMGPTGSLQPNCNAEGTNQFSDVSRVRLGILGNNEEDCATPDSRIGVGGGGLACVEPTPTAGCSTCYGGDNGDVELPAFAWVFVR